MNIESVEKHYQPAGLYARYSDKNVWLETSALAKEYNTINLGQGFPDYASYKHLDAKIEEVLNENNPLLHQYTRSQGHLRLVNVLGRLYSHFMKRSIDPLNEVLVTVGGYGGLLNSFQSLINDNDEIVIIEPFFDAYRTYGIIAGAKCRFVPLRPVSDQNESIRLAKEWKWNEQELEEAFTSKTRFVIINTPNNPLGKVYSRPELERIAELCIKHNVICVSDEVYEHICYNQEHIRIATLPGMWERTLTIGSAGKTFSSTGLKLGWMIGPKELIKKCSVVHSNSYYCYPTFFQEVVARCFEDEYERLVDTKSDSYFNTISTELLPKRDRLASILIKCGLRPIAPQGGYFMLGDISHLTKFQTDSEETKDVKFVKFLIKEKRIGAVPVSVFYSPGNHHIGENYVRFCFFKQEESLNKVEEILSSLNVEN